MRSCIALYVALFAMAIESKAQISSTVIVQETSGWCSPAIANVVGNVTVKCIGVDPRALSVLNQKLRNEKRQRQEIVKEADEWAARYHSLEEQLSQQSTVSVRATPCRTPATVAEQPRRWA
jgi:hypothetical protein